MSTIDNKTIIDDIIAGKYACDHPKRIVEYTNAWGNKAWGVTFGNEDPNAYLVDSPYIKNPRIIWEANQND